MTAGNLFLLPEEAAAAKAAEAKAEAAEVRVEREQQRAECLAVQLRELWEDPNALQ